MRYPQAHAAKSGSIPFTLRGPKSMRALLSAAVAGVIGLAPAFVYTSPAAAVGNDPNINAVSGRMAEGSAVTFSITNAGNVAGTFTVEVVADPTAGAHPAVVTGTGADIGTPSVTTFATVSSTFPITVTVPTTQDETYEYDETFRINVLDAQSNVVSYAIGTVANDDPLPRLTLTGGGSVAEDASPAVFTLQSDRASDLAITAQWGLAADVTPASGHGRATADDFTIPADRTVTLSAGAQTATINVPIRADALDEYDEDFAVTLSGPTNAELGTPATVPGTIVDEAADVGPTVVITPNNTTTAVVEGNTGRRAQTFTAALSGPSGKTVRVNWSTADIGTGVGNALAGRDYVRSSGQLVFDPGVTTQTFTVDIIGDTVDEGTAARTSSIEANTGYEEFQILTTAVPGETQPSLSASVQPNIRIADDDAAPTVTFGDMQVEEGDDTTAVLVPIRLTGSSDQPISFAVADAGGGTASNTPSATIGSGDYTLLNTTFTVQPGMTNGYAVVMVNGDDIYEPTETVNLTATPQAAGAGADWLASAAADPATLSIGNDDQAPNLEINTVTGDEGETVTVTGTVTGVSASPTLLNVTFTPGSVGGRRAADPADFTNPGAQAITVDPGTLSGTIMDVGTVRLTDDTEQEPDESIVVSGFGLGNIGTVTSGAVIIAANDGATPEEPGEQPAAGAPTISTPAASIRGTGNATIAGTAAAGATVELWGRAFGATGASTRLRTVTAGATGAYSFTHPITQGMIFQTAVGGQLSREIAVRVTQNPVFTLTSPSRGNFTVTVTGNPRAAGQAVLVQSWVSGAWKTVYKGTTGANGVYTRSAQLASGRSLTMRAFVAGDTRVGILGSWTASRRVTIR